MTSEKKIDLLLEDIKKLVLEFPHSNIIIENNSFITLILDIGNRIDCHDLEKLEELGLKFIIYNNKIQIEYFY